MAAVAYAVVSLSTLFQAIHDIAAQTAYMIGLGIHRARNLADESNLAGESNQELKAALDATLELAIRLRGKRLDELWPRLPALVVSAYEDEGNQASAMDRGAPGFAVMPVDVVKPAAYHGLRGAMAESD